MTPGVLARHLDGNRVAPKVWANRRLVAPLFARFIRTLLTDRQGTRYRLLGHLWLECERFLAPNVLNVDLADLNVEGTLVEGDVTRHCRLVLCAMCKLFECRTVFEIGTYHGQTTWLIARNNPEARVFTLDLPSLDSARQLQDRLTDPEYFVAWNRGIKFAGTPEAARITQLFGDSATFDFSPYRGTMDLVFIDGSHSYEYARSDTEAALSMLSERGTIVWDDYPYYPGIYRVINDLAPRLDRPVFHIVGTRLAVYSRINILEKAGRPTCPTLTGQPSQ